MIFHIDTLLRTSLFLLLDDRCRSWSFMYWRVFLGLFYLHQYTQWQQTQSRLISFILNPTSSFQKPQTVFSSSLLSYFRPEPQNHELLRVVLRRSRSTFTIPHCPAHMLSCVEERHPTNMLLHFVLSASCMSMTRRYNLHGTP